MAKQTVIQLTDDLDGSEATQSIEFSFRGRSFTIDLNDSNAADFDDALAPYIAAAEKSGCVQPSRSSGRRAGGARQPASSDVDPKQVRAWAQANGVAV
ncbi:MAG: Lsr2 family protein, partial [Actinomycetota bacterium]|nr:Lsr2 family protein [Actinomycetota bacterium]